MIEPHIRYKIGRKMNKKVVSRAMLTLLAISILTSAFGIQQAESSEPPPTEWVRTFGGVRSDYAYSVVQTTDGGYAIAGFTFSFGAGSRDFWLVKTDPMGNMQWNQTYGGAYDEEAYSVVQTNDGGYAIAGYTDSFGGGVRSDYAYSVVQTTDGGYAIAGFTFSFGAGSRDFWLVKTDPTGNMQWNQTYGGTNYDYAYSVVQTTDGGYAIAGFTFSFGAGEDDFWLLKTDALGNEQWNKTYGGVRSDEARSVVQTDDGGYAIAGLTYSFGAGHYDFWLIKTDSAGNMQWNQTYGGTSSEGAYSLVHTSDGGYALAGYTRSFGAGGSDFWLVKTDPTGKMQWNQTYGGADSDFAYSVVQTDDGGYALTGLGGLLPFGVGGDFWLAKVAPTEYTPAVGVSISSPENKTYSADGVPLTFTVSEFTSWIGYSLDGQMNMTITGNTTLHGLPDGTHSITVYANDTTGNVGASEMVYFTIETQQEEPFPTWIIAVIVIIAIFGVALLVYFTKVKKTT